MIEDKLTSAQMPTYLILSRLRDRLHWEPLASVVLDTTEYDHGYSGTLLLDNLEDVFLSKYVLSLARK